MADNGSLNGDVSGSSTDPAADFLAREQETLAGLDDDLNLNPGHTNGISDHAFGETNGHSDDESGIVRGGGGSSDVYSSSSVTYDITPKTEPEKIRVWREEQERMLKQKDEEELIRREELKQTAIKELNDWRIRYADQLEKSKKNNKHAEQEWLAERDQEDPGQEWEKIGKLCDFNPKAGRKDTSRLRSILLQLKQSPPPNNGN